MKRKDQRPFDIRFGGKAPGRQYFSSGFPELDEKLGGGVPRGFVTVISGADGQGKSTLAFSTARSIQRSDLAVMIVDIARGLSDKRLLLEELADDHLVVPRAPTFEDLTEKLPEIILWVQEGLAEKPMKVGGVIVDPIDGLPTRNQHLTDNNRRDLLDNLLRRLHPLLGEWNLSLIVICRTMKDSGMLFGNPNRPLSWLDPLLHSASIHLRVSIDEYLRNESKEVIGRKLRVRILKNQEGLPPGECSVAKLYKHAHLSSGPH